MRNLICITELDSDFPFALSTLYVGKYQKRYDFLTHTGPTGIVTRRLWVDVDKFNLFMFATGRRYRLKSSEEAHA